MLYLSSGVLFVGSSANQLEDLGMFNRIKSLRQVTIYIYLHCRCSVYSNPTKLIPTFCVNIYIKLREEYHTDRSIR